MAKDEKNSDDDGRPTEPDKDLRMKIIGAERIEHKEKETIKSTGGDQERPEQANEDLSQIIKKEANPDSRDKK